MPDICGGSQVAYLRVSYPPPPTHEPYTIKKPCRNAPNSDVDNGGAEPNDVGVGILRPPRRLVRATVVHIGISRSFFTVYSIQYNAHQLGTQWRE